MATLEEAKAFLKQKSARDGLCLYDHLSDVLQKILVERPENAEATFEAISLAVKQNRYIPPLALTDQGNEKNSDSAIRKENLSQAEQWCNSAFDLLKVNSEEDGGNGEGAVESVADLLDESNMFQWAGLGFSRGETFRLSLSLQKLAQRTGATSLRLWGKVLGIGWDYYIAEGEITGLEEPNDPDSEEGPGIGVNKYTYWALKDDGSYVWGQLPPVTCAQILIARQLHRFLHPDLEAPVISHPPFPGLEKHYLRAQIARISSSTVVCPSGYFQVSEEDETVIEPVEEIEVKTTSDLLSLENWVHFRREINEKYGRQTRMSPITNEDGEEVPRDDEEFAPPLRALIEDRTSSWRIDRVPKTIIPAVGEIAVLRSLNWPGAASIAVGKKFLNIYVGNCTKYLSSTYQFPHPLPIQRGYGVSETNGDGEDTGQEGNRSLLLFENLTPQPDVLDDPAPDEED